MFNWNKRKIDTVVVEPVTSDMHHNSPTGTHKGIPIAAVRLFIISNDNNYWINYLEKKNENPDKCVAMLFTAKRQRKTELASRLGRFLTAQRTAPVAAGADRIEAERFGAIVHPAAYGLVA